MIDSADNATHPLPVTGPTRVHFLLGARQMYTVDLCQDLFGHWVLTQTWSGTPLQRAGGKKIVVDGHEAGLAMLQKIAKQKERSGFEQVQDYHVRSLFL